jgi:mevalonate kinase
MTIYHYSAPGNTMIMGEHAVLNGHPAIACAVAARMHARLEPRSDRALHIHSALGHYSTQLDAYQPSPTLRFICRAIEQFELIQGFDLYIDSAFSDQVGLGSSAAVTLTTLACLSAWQGRETSKTALLEKSLALVRQVQGYASGTDLAASCFGGMIYFEPEQLTVRALPLPPALQLYYVGYKTPTADVIAHVKTLSEHHPTLFAQLYAVIGATTQAAQEAALEENWTRFGHLMNLHQGLQDALGTNNADLSRLVYSLRDSNALAGVKISGSGLGDSVLALKLDRCAPFPQCPEFPSIPFTIDLEGLRREEDFA